MAVQRLARAATVVAAGAYLGSLVPGVRHGAGASTFWDVGVYASAPLLAGLACAARAFRVRRDRLAWSLIAGGLTSYAAGTLVFNAILLPSGDVPYPSIADALWLMLYPAVIVAIALLARARIAGHGMSVWLDGVVSGLGLASLSAAVVFPRVTANAGGGAAEIATNVAYPILDLALVITAVGVLTSLGTWRDRSWLLLGAGFLTFTFADSWYLLADATGTYHPGSLIDATYLAAAAMIALASKDRGRGREEVRRDPQSRSFAIPGAFALLAIGVLTMNATSHAMVVAIVLAAGALTAAWLRTALTIREVVLLSDSRRQARTDALTGLPNRRAFYEVLEAAGRQYVVGAPYVGSVVLADLDRFKEINDAVGHQLGDQLLREVSRRFAALVPAGGTIARLGGDELAMFVPGMTPDDAAGLSRTLLSTLQDPFWIQDLSLHLAASIGITGIESGSGITNALAKADLAMYRAKESHTGWEIYDDERDGDAWDRLSIGEDLREALSSGLGLTVEFQPICATATLEPVGVEALIRWTHPDRGRIPPDQFLPLAEKAGLMPAITRTVLDLSLDEAVRLRDHGWSISVSVNLSASDLLDDNLVEQVGCALAERSLPGKALRIEITESLLVDTGTGAADRLVQLRALGVDLAVDDYGTGYSCLAYLHDLPVSYLKIDRCFVDRMLRDERTALIVASTVQMAHGLGLKVVAEGLETAEQQDWLAEHACDLLQGYLLSKPLPAELLHRWLAERIRRPSALPARR
jgi:diguanylate cyclase (GGDEF)-like protein